MNKDEIGSIIPLSNQSIRTLNCTSNLEDPEVDLLERRCNTIPLHHLYSNSASCPYAV